MIHAQNFSWQFNHAPNQTLHPLNFKINPGQLVAITGPSGAGKSTLAAAFAGLLKPPHTGKTTGSLTVANLDALNTPLPKLAQHIALVQQNPDAHFATLTVTDELAFGLENRQSPPNHIRSAVNNALDALQINHLATRPLNTLSGGEKQRVAIASVLAFNPRILVLDEPSASLDPAAANTLFQLLAKLRNTRNLTIIIIEHRLEPLLPFKPRVLQLEAGSLAADIPPGHTTPETLPLPASIPPPDTTQQPLAEARNIRVDYNNRPALHNLSLALHTGNIVALMGPNGSGKSTLLQALVGLVPLAAGHVRLLDQPVTPRNTPQRANHVGFIFQNADHQLLAETVWDEALYTTRALRQSDPATAARAKQLLQSAGLETRLNDHPHRLSWGEKRRLNIIAATLHNPRLLLLDEPFAGQDAENAKFLINIIRNTVNTAPGGACLIVTHDPRLVRQTCNRLIFLDAGRLIVDAPNTHAFQTLQGRGYHHFLTTTPLPENHPPTRSQTPPLPSSKPHPADTTEAPHNQLEHPSPTADQTEPPPPNPITTLHPATKILWLLWFTIAAFATNSATLPLTLTAAVILLFTAAGFPPWRIPRWRTWLTITLAVFITQLLFVRTGEQLLGPLTTTSLHAATRAAARLLTVLLASSLFVNTTHPANLAAGLVQLGLPYRWGFALATALRLAPLFRLEANQVYRAQRIRGIGANAAQPRRAWLTLRHMLFPMLLSALRTAQSLSTSMEGRAFGLHPTRTSLRNIRLLPHDYAALLILAAATIITSTIFTS